MIRRCNSSKGFFRSGERGDVLTEALISVLLFAIAGVGITYIVSTVTSSQRDFKVQQQVINELRTKLQQGADSAGLCGSGALETENFSAEISVQGCAQTTATVGGISISGVQTPVSLSVDIDGLGSVRVGGRYAQ